jgi:hypothetical protein
MSFHFSFFSFCISASAVGICITRAFSWLPQPQLKKRKFVFIYLISEWREGLMGWLKSQRKRAYRK